MTEDDYYGITEGLAELRCRESVRGPDIRDELGLTQHDVWDEETEKRAAAKLTEDLWNSMCWTFKKATFAQGEDSK